MGQSELGKRRTAVHVHAYHPELYRSYVPSKRQADRQTDRQTDTQRDTLTDRQTNRQADRQKNRQAGRQAGRQAYKNTERGAVYISLSVGLEPQQTANQNRGGADDTGRDKVVWIGINSRERRETKPSELERGGRRKERGEERGTREERKRERKGEEERCMREVHVHVSVVAIVTFAADASVLIGNLAGNIFWAS